ncbi:MAG: dihydroorotate dehydrogenase electron transfer subunit [Lentisphaeria bacterium]|nr:dihydroorotate dehydrogenase electron transfer subunit [Lentisphaeria bacterium]
MKAEILENVNLKGDYYQIRFASAEVASDARPGQFVHVRIDERRDFMLRRPFSIKDAENGVVTLLYKVVGKGTAALSTMKKGEFCDLMGPQGTPFTPRSDYRALIIVGGYGAAATWQLTRSMPGGVVLLGARSADDLLLTKEYADAGFDVCIATNDGSVGKKGFVTELIPEVMAEKSEKPFFIYGCGPKPMLMALAALMRKENIPGELSLDEIMCCGVGSCFGCVVKVNDSESADKFRYARSCVEGPVFPAENIYIGD